MSSAPRSIPTEDRISNLPDSVIYHILSFLPTKQSAATSILSKKWNPLWLSVLALDFETQDFADFAAFRHFVYSVMLSRNITLPIRSLRLKCGKSYGFDAHDVNRFIQAAVQRGIQNLNLDMCFYQFNLDTWTLFQLPECVLTCNSLTVLKLKQIKILPSEGSTNRHEIGDDDSVDPSIVPKCLSSELRTCSLLAYEGTKCEFQFAEYILKNAKTLHTMKISASKVDLNIKHQMLLKLSLCPRGSATCKLSFD
ncbi:hypothetical protein TSUD_173490 [Trifolium subterraneum]|nr:hypothetical protein TSUD_173490 [Trifolium subterraneum]